MANYQDQMREVERRRRRAQLLQQYAQQPQLSDAGMFAQGPTALSGLAGLASALGGAYQNRKADKEEKQARADEQTRLAQAMQRILKGGNAPGSDPATGEGGLVMNAAPDPQTQGALDLLQGMPLEQQQQLVAGQAISRLFPSAKEGYTLKPGETRYGGDNKPLASMPTETKPEKSTIGALNAADYTPQSLAKYKDSGNYADLQPIVKPDKTADKDTWMTMTPEEIQASGLPSGTSAQKNSRGQINVLSKRDNTGSLSQKDATTAKLKLNAIKLARQQLGAVKDAFDKGVGGGMNAFGPTQGWMPTEAGQMFDKRVDTMRDTLTSITRTPGIGSMSDFETKLGQRKMPARSDREAITADNLQQLDNMLAFYENGYNDLLSGGTQGGAQPAAPAQPAAATPAHPAGAPVAIKSDAEFDALPSGAEFIAPDGSHRRKP
jgi:hypothetical protein